MNIDLGSFAFGSSLNSGGGTPSWGTALGQARPDYKFTYPGSEAIIIGMTYCSVPLTSVSLPLGKGGHIYQASELEECQLASLFRKVYINGLRIDYPFVMVLIKEESDSHTGRRSIKYSDKNTFQLRNENYSNQDFIRHARRSLNLAENACWFVYNFEVENQDELHMSAVFVDENNSVSYENSSERRNEWLALIPDSIEVFNTIKTPSIEDNKNLQQIFYGAPGTGKSYSIKKKLKEMNVPKENIFRTTFHPDSDYSTFIGCYKPSMKSKDRIYSAEELAVKLKEIKNSGVTYPCHKFAAQYWRSLKDLSADVIKQILNACGFTETMNVEISKGVAIGQEYLNKEEDGKIIYTFTPQAFTNAYVKAWNTTEDVYLIIEEINRGNCAQIFGDLFQLLDRGGDGQSEYPINADTDLGNYISKELNDSTRTDFPDDVKSGEKLMLPSNLYIWATMNTSDQSLFPIDSAFKRRWDWKYIPISDAGKNYVIEIDNDQYDWCSFLTAINTIIESTTHSEDKKLGYFFAKAKDGRITADTFVSKVIFYLWNDVFKDNESNHKAFKDSNGEMLAFHRFFHDDGSVDTNVVIKFLQDLEVYPFEVLGDGTSAPNITVPNAKRQRDNSRYSVNGTDNLNKAQMTREAFRQYIEAHPEADAQTIAQAWRGLGLKNDVQHLVETEDEFKARTENSIDTNKRATEFELSNGEKVYLSTQFGIGNIGKFIDAVNNAGWNIRIDKLA